VVYALVFFMEKLLTLKEEAEEMWVLPEQVGNHFI